MVVATGGYQAPRIPVFATELDPSIVQFHSSQYRNPSQLRDGGVLVVGAGNSGAEIALESSSGHQTWLSGRDTGQEPVRAGSLSDRLFTPPFWFLLSHVLTTRNPIGRKVRDQLSNQGLPLARVRRKDLVRARVERVPRVTGVRDGLPLLAGRRRPRSRQRDLVHRIRVRLQLDRPARPRSGRPTQAPARRRPIGTRAVLHGTVLPVGRHLVLDRRRRQGCAAHRPAHHREACRSWQHGGARPPPGGSGVELSVQAPVQVLIVGAGMARIGLRGTDSAVRVTERTTDLTLAVSCW